MTKEQMKRVIWNALMVGPMSDLEARVDAAIDQIISNSKIIGNGFTPDDFKDRDGNPASPEAAAHIANRRLGGLS